MSLSGLPVLVIEQILDLLDFPEYLALSSTCKSLHYPAHRYLYNVAHIFCRNAKNPYETFSSLERSLTLTTATYLREYVPSNNSNFRFFWKGVPLTLDHLDLYGIQGFHFPFPWLERHPRTLLRKVSLRVSSWISDHETIPVSEKYQGCFELLASLYSFQGLKTLKMKIPVRQIFPLVVQSENSDEYAEYFGDTIGQYISRINCPQLEHLIIEGHHSTGLAVPAIDTFPNLKFFEIIHWDPVSYRSDNFSKSDGFTEDDDLQTLAQLKQRNIASRYGGKSAVLLLEFLLSKYARNESEFTDYTLWLLKSEYRLQDPSGPFVLYVPDLGGG
jgi:hypothetical protein